MEKLTHKSFLLGLGIACVFWNSAVWAALGEQSGQGAKGGYCSLCVMSSLSTFPESRNPTQVVGSGGGPTGGQNGCTNADGTVCTRSSAAEKSSND